MPKSLEAPSIGDEHGVPIPVVYDVSGNARASWSLVNARKAIGYAPEEDVETECAAEIRRDMVAPACRTQLVR